MKLSNTKQLSAPEKLPVLSRNGPASMHPNREGRGQSDRCKKAVQAD